MPTSLSNAIRFTLYYHIKLVTTGGEVDIMLFKNTNVTLNLTGTVQFIEILALQPLLKLILISWFQYWLSFLSVTWYIFQGQIQIFFCLV